MGRSWYSGSDRSGVVVAGIDELDAIFDQVSPVERVERLQGLLSAEHEPNWRGYLLFRIAVNLLDAGSSDDGVRVLKEAVSTFDPLEPTIRDVFPQFGGAIHFLIKEHLFEAGRFEEVVELGTVLIANLGAARLDKSEAALALSYVGLAYSKLGHANGLPFMQKAAKALHIAAHFRSPNDPDFLQDLIYAHFRTGDMVGCRKAHRLFEAASPSEESRRRVNEFLRSCSSGSGEMAGPM